MRGITVYVAGFALAKATSPTLAGPSTLYQPPVNDEGTKCDYSTNWGAWEPEGNCCSNNPIFGYHRKTPITDSISGKQWYRRRCNVNMNGNWYPSTTCNCLGTDVAYNSVECGAVVCPPKPYCAWGTWTITQQSRTTCIKTSTRTCVTNTGNPSCCVGSNGLSVQTKTELIAGCSVAPGKIWGDWSAWSATCVGGKQERTRPCVSSDRNLCQGLLIATRLCTAPPPVKIWGEWGPWGGCGADSKKERRRPCISNNPFYCQGDLIETTMCEKIPLKIWGAWTGWGSCKGGKMTRSRACITKDTYYCRGRLYESQQCATPNNYFCNWYNKQSVLNCVNRGWCSFMLKNWVTKSYTCFTRWNLSIEQQNAFMEKTGFWLGK